MNNRIYPYQGQRVTDKRDNWAIPVHSKYPLPCIIGRERKNKKELWIAFDENLYVVKTRDKAIICKTQELAELIVNFCGGYMGFTKIFVEAL